jgi:hypothetical protein
VCNTVSGVQTCSSAYSFVVPPAVGSTTPFTIGVLADMGQTSNSQNVYSGMLVRCIASLAVLCLAVL